MPGTKIYLKKKRHSSHMDEDPAEGWHDEEPGLAGNTDKHGEEIKDPHKDTENWLSSLKDFCVVVVCMDTYNITIAYILDTVRQAVQWITNDPCSKPCCWVAVSVPGWPLFRDQ